MVCIYTVSSFDDDLKRFPVQFTAVPPFTHIHSHSHSASLLSMGQFGFQCPAQGSFGMQMKMGIKLPTSGGLLLYLLSCMLSALHCPQGTQTCHKHLHTMQQHCSAAAVIAIRCPKPICVVVNEWYSSPVAVQGPCRRLYRSFSFLVLFLSKKDPVSFLGISQALFAFIRLPVINTLLQSITSPSLYRAVEVRGEGYWIRTPILIFKKWKQILCKLSVVSFEHFSRSAGHPELNQGK